MAWKAGEGYAQSFKNIDKESGSSLTNSHFETGYVCRDFFCGSFPLPMALLTLPLLGEPSMAPNPTY